MWSSIPTFFDGFIAGFGYGIMSVIVGQPFDTIKTRSQMPKFFTMNPLQIAKDIVVSDGLRGLYRGGGPLVLGGALIRSAQFGVHTAVLIQLRDMTTNGNPIEKKDKFLNIFDWHIIVAGFCGGVSRGLIEGPFEYIKVRRQLNEPWRFNEVLHGSSATIARNSILFSSFMVYQDLTRQLIPGILTPFWEGALCANLAWFTVWPMDVVKTMVQSGNYNGRSIPSLLVETVKTRALFRGLLPGLLRSTVANGTAMVVYRHILDAISQEREKEMKKN
jgi:solute carrier family 25 (mitochondrial carnitine/acylcarnitine transporter), member 20/29